MTRNCSARILLCAKSSWDPPIRREHGVTTAAAASGYCIDFVEQARDIRSLDPRRPERSNLTARLVPPARVRVIARFTPVPGHRNQLAHKLDAGGLRRTLRQVISNGPQPLAAVVNAPWNWAATSVLPTGTRMVADFGDDWTRLLPQRHQLVLRDYRRIAAEADAIIVVAPAMADLFGRNDVVVIPNAVAPELLATTPVDPPRHRRMVYVGTLSERFDADLMGEVLTRLPGWSLDLYGPCHYAGRGGRPDPGLTRLIQRHADRVRWHGVVNRSRLGSVIDLADVAVLPNDPAISAGQDSMKLYDYAARGRPIVATPIRVPPDGPGVLALAADPAEFASAVERLDGCGSATNRAWAEANAWSSRLPHWIEAVTGTPVPPAG